ncbi:sulfatase [Sphingobacterium faecium NBRC 15299]|uniref:sulfatase family protein n=1 Tax=Sphingobacterium faecium TaxID=34087 RepID=UPI000D3ACED4|nr:sulfatase [Sphingobacterium faecium]PTX11431.1 arylsulfatase A-like enzyme [Sphingobacterium faecium]GEM66368.1 sulfatase [Sphingobacterium faecium NBRC 15299]
MLKPIFRKLLFLLLPVLSSFSPPAKKVKNTKPNIIFILSDDHTNKAIGIYGNKLAKTPHIDRIAKEGALFNNFFVTNSICGPSRAALLTGKYSHVNGFISNDKKFNIDQFIFSRSLEDSGYQTAWIGKWHLETLPQDAFNYWTILPNQGHYFNPNFITQSNDTVTYKGYVTDIITDLSKDWIRNRDQDKPFLLMIGEKATHREWLRAVEDLGSYDDIDFPIPPSFYDNYHNRIAAAHQDMSISETMQLGFDLKVNVDYDSDWIYSRLDKEQRAAYRTYYGDYLSKEFNEKNLKGKALTEWKFQRYMRDYFATANALDRNIGKILDFLDENGLAENTIVIYGSDQGFYLGEHGWFDKRFIYEESLRTPFMIRYPGLIKPGTVIEQSLLNIDWAPTLLEMAGVSVPQEIQGKSFSGLLQNKMINWRDHVYYHYYEYPQPHRVMPHFGIRTSKYKLVRFYGDQNFWELYNLEQDPQELNNIYKQFENSKLVKKLKEDLKVSVLEYKDDLATQIIQK